MDTYEDFRKTLRAMQIDEVLRIYQENYDVYLKK